MAHKNKKTGGKHKGYHNRSLSQRLATGNKSAVSASKTKVCTNNLDRKKLALKCARSK